MTCPTTFAHAGHSSGKRSTDAMSRIRASGAALALSCMVANVPALAQDAGFGPPGTPFVLRTQGHCLEVNEPQVQVDGARVQLGRCDGRPHQAWRTIVAAS
jgi:hypothetical protein